MTAAVCFRLETCVCACAGSAQNHSKRRRTLGIDQNDTTSPGVRVCLPNSTRDLVERLAMILSKRRCSICTVKILHRKEQSPQMTLSCWPGQLKTKRLWVCAAVFLQQGCLCTPCLRGGIPTTGHNETLEPVHAFVADRGGMFSSRNVRLCLRWGGTKPQQTAPHAGDRSK